MKTLLLFIFSPKNGILNFQDRFRDNLYLEGVVLAFIYALPFIFNEILDTHINILFKVFSIVVTICLWLLSCMILSFITYKIGLFLKGNSNYKETFALLMYAYFPIFIMGVFLHFLMYPFLREFRFNTNLFRVTIFLLSWLASLRILLIGLKVIYNLDLKKTIIVMLPILLFFSSGLLMSVYLFLVSF